jgi:dienelactone hydrolase
MRIPILFILLIAVALCESQVMAQDRGQTVWVPMNEDSQSGAKEIKLEATLYKPAGEGPFPVVIFNHGSTGPGAIPATQTENPWGFGTYLNQRGIALFIPMRRGRGRSEGVYAETYGCDLSSSKAGITYATAALDATFEFLRSQSWADMQRVVLAGQSRGGILATIYAAEKPGVATGVINFVGGWVGDGCTARTGIDVNSILLSEAGSKSKIPNLFLYARGDSYYSEISIEKYLKNFQQSGGEVTFRLYSVTANANGHVLFYRFFTLWIPETDMFFRRIGVWNGVLK